MLKLINSIALCLLLAFSSHIIAADQSGNYDAGKEKSANCAGCHGATGISNAPSAFPSIAGLEYNYIVDVLMAYRSGEKENSTMNGMTQGLSDQDIRDLAAYFSQQDTE